MILPTLYKPAKSGATQQLNISTDESIVVVSFGQVDGKQQVKETLCNGKNLGRSNETTAQQQAELEAQSKWDKKIKEGYSTTIQEQSTVNLPMKIHTYQEYSHKIKFPCFVSPKLNGVNAEYHLLPEPHITSRGGESYPIVHSRDDHVFSEMKKHNINSVNGEIYLHGHHLQDIQSAVKKPSASKLQPTLWAFDLPIEKGGYKHRINKLQQTDIDTIYFKIADSHEMIKHYHKEFVSLGYEGTIVRNVDGLYEYNTRSYDVLKLKDVQDAEFLIVDHNIDKNGHPVFICEIDTGANFKVKPKGTDAERKAILADIDNYLGHWYKIEFEMYSKDNIPLKPVGIGLRQCDSYGNPTE